MHANLLLIIHHYRRSLQFDDMNFIRTDKLCSLQRVVQSKVQLTAFMNLSQLDDKILMFIIFHLLFVVKVSKGLWTLKHSWNRDRKPFKCLD